MTINSEAEFQAAQDVFRKYRFSPGRSKNHPLQASLDILADAVSNYKYLNRDVHKAA